MALPEFHHIHCSSRYDRSAASLETDLDDWMAKSSLITLTEITNDRRAATMREKGWGYYNHNIGVDSDNCGICWASDTWKRVSGQVRRLENIRYARLNGRAGLFLYSATVVLKRVDSGHKLLVSVSHLPAHVEGANGFRTDLDQWRARKVAYLSALKNWSTHVKDAERKGHVDATLIVADWNLNLKDDWVRSLLRDHWGPNYQLAWKLIPTSGGVLLGGPEAPGGAPGRGTKDRIIDGTLYRGVKPIEGPFQMARVRSSDHRPYSERFRFLDKAEKPVKESEDPPHGDTHKGEEWWGFGDYMDDELYAIDRQTGVTGGEVL